MKKTKVALCGGGTGGHVFPLVDVARSLKKLSPQVQIYFVGPEEFSLASLRQEGIRVKKIIAAGKLRRYFSLWYLWELFKLPWAAIQSFLTIFFINPDAMLGKGSYGSVLPILSARILGKKIILHDSDVRPGAANRFLAKFVKNIAVSFEETTQFFPRKNIIVTGNPIRHNYINITRPEAEKALAFTSEKPIIFISGGSQGAQKINKTIHDSLEKLLEKYAVIWSVGANNLETIKHSVSNNNTDLKIIGLLGEKELAAAYMLCDIVIGRAGSGTIFEAAAFGKSAILIPLERRAGDQPLNAKAYAGTGAALVLKEAELNPATLLSAVEYILSSREEMNLMSQNAQKFAKIEAGENLAKILLNLATRNK